MQSRALWAGRVRRDVRRTGPGKRSGTGGRAGAREHHGHQASKTCTSRAVRGWPRVGRRYARGDLAHVNGQAYLVVPVSPATIDALAAIEAEAEDREDDPARVQGDDELALVE